MMNAGNLKGKTRQTSDWRRRMIAFVSALTLLISSCGLTAFAETDEDIYSDPVTAPIPAANTSPEPEEGEAQATPAPEGQPETGTEPQETTGEGTEPEEEPEVSEEPKDLTVYEPGTLTAEADGVGITVDYTTEARVPEGTVLTLTRAAGGDLYSALKSASKVLKTEENATWKRELGEDAVFYAISLTNPEGNEVHPETGVTLTCTNLEIPANATGFVTGENAENLDWKDTLTVEFLPDAIGYAYLKQVQIGTVTLTHEDRDYMVTAAYGPDAGFPADIELKVREILPGTPEYALYSGMTDEALNEDWAEITLERYFDIAFVANGEEMEPKADVDVQIVFRDKLEQNEETEVAAVHIENNEANVIEAETDSTKSARHDDEAIDTVTFTSDSFSVYGVVQKKKIITKVLAADGNTYEIEISYTQEAEIPEESQVKVEEIPEGSDLWEAYRKQTAAALNADDVRLPGIYDISIIDAEGTKVEPKAPVSVSIKLANAEANNEDLHVVHFTEEIPQELVEAEAKSEEQTEVQPIAEEDKIESENIKANVEGDTVTFDTQGFSVYAFAYKIVTYYKTASGETYKITLNYDENSGIPAGAELNVNEILPETEAYLEYISKSAETLGKEDTSMLNARFFDIEIIKDGEKIEPNGNVSVSVVLDEMPTEEDQVNVIHFKDAGTEIVGNVETTADSIQFQANSFSVYGIITEPNAQSTTALNGRSVFMSLNGYYLTSEVLPADWSHNKPIRIKHSQNSSDAALWFFEDAGTGNSVEHHVYTLVDGVKKYMTIGVTDHSDRYNLSLENSPQTIKVVKMNGSEKYYIYKRINDKNYYINLWDWGRSEGYAAYGSYHAELELLDFTFSSVVNSSYAVIVHYENDYYAVQNDGSLAPVVYDPSTKKVELGYPLLWNYTQYNGAYNLKVPTEGKNYHGSGVATEFYYRYINVNTDDGISTENKDAQNKADACRFVFENNRMHGYGGENGNHYLGVTLDSKGVPIAIAGNKAASQAVEVLLAKVDTAYVPTYFAKNNSVNHIDISVHGSAEVTYPLPKGTYYYGNGEQLIVTRENPKSVTLTEKVRITKEDIKKAEIIAKDKAGKELDNVFYVTGYSGNKGQDDNSENPDMPTQIRIEGSFLVSSNVTATYPNYSGTENGNWNWLRGNTQHQQVRGQRLASEITYTVNTTKTVKFTLKDGDRILYKDSQAQEPVTIEVPVTLTGSCSYWSTKNQCPGINENGGDKSNRYGPWAQGCIVGDGGTLSSGIDFTMGASTKAITDSYPAIDITKYIVDTNGDVISIDDEISNSFSVYQIDNSESLSSECNNDYNAYSMETDLSVQVSNGMGKNYYDLNVLGAMVYIEEDKGTIPQTITANGKEWKYIRTVIETENVRRTSGSESLENHKTGNLTMSDTYYRSIPELAGIFKHNGADKDNPILNFYVYNVYEQVTSISVVKEWSDGSANHTLDTVKVQLYKAYEESGTPSVTPPEETVNLTVSGISMPSDATSSVTISIDGTEYTLNQTNGWTKQLTGITKGSSHTVSVNGVAGKITSATIGSPSVDASGNISYTISAVVKTEPTVLGPNAMIPIEYNIPESIKNDVFIKVYFENFTVNGNNKNEGRGTIDANVHNGQQLPSSINLNNRTNIERIAYTVVEQQPYPGYRIVISSDAGTSETVGTANLLRDGTTKIIITVVSNSSSIVVYPEEIRAHSVLDFLIASASADEAGKTMAIPGTEFKPADAVAVGSEIELNSGDIGWTYTWENLPKTENVGGVEKAVYYFVVETWVSNNKVASATYAKTMQTDDADTEDDESERIDTVTITNNIAPDTGNLIVTKTVKGNAANSDDDFSFMVVLSDTTISGQYGEMDFTSGVATFTLKDGESKTATNIPVGVTYTVEETDKNGYELESYSGKTGTIEATAPKIASFINTKNIFADLTLKKVINGETDPDKSFKFTLSILNASGQVDTSLNGEHYGKNFTAGEVSVNLKNNDTFQLTQLPNLTQYMITEEDDQAFETTATVNNVSVTLDHGTLIGTITSTTAIEVTYTNTKVPTVEISAKKDWGAVGNTLGATAVQFTLMRKIGDEGTPEAVMDSNNPAIVPAETWSVTWTDLPKYTDSTQMQTYTYYVEETGVFFGELDDGVLPAGATCLDEATTAQIYTIAGSGESIVINAEDKGSAQISNTPRYVNIPVIKTWPDFSGDEYTWDIEFALKQRDVPVNETPANEPEWRAVLDDNNNPVTVQISKATSENAFFSNLPTYRLDDGTVYMIQYTVDEISYTVMQGSTVVAKWDINHPENNKGTVYIPSVQEYAGENTNTYRIVVNNEIDNSDHFVVRKEWLDVLPGDLAIYPEVYFTLYQMEEGIEDVNHFWVYENENGGKYVDIPLNKGNNWTWVCPEELPEKNTETNRKYKYFVIETPVGSNGGDKTTGLEIKTNPTYTITNGIVFHIDGYRSRDKYGEGSWKQADYYKEVWNDGRRYNVLQEGRTEYTEPQGAGVYYQGEIVIRNCARKYMQMDIKKKFLWYNPEQYNSLYTTTSTPKMMTGLVIEVQVMRRALYDNAPANTPEGGTGEVFGWKPYGNRIVVGYNENGQDVCINPNLFNIRYCGPWHWTIDDTLQDQGLLAYGIYQQGDTIIPVRYQYLIVETNAYKYSGGEFGEPYDWVAVLPWAWDGNGQQVDMYPRYTAQDQDRLINVQASNLKIQKKWKNNAVWPSDVKEVYFKVYRYRDRNANGDPEDYTNNIGTAIGPAIARLNGDQTYNIDGYVASDRFYPSVTSADRYLRLDAQNPYLTIEHMLIAPVKGDDARTYFYLIKECGYQDLQGNVIWFKDMQNPESNPHYLKPAYNIGINTHEITLNNHNITGYSSAILLAAKGKNEFIITNELPPPTTGSLSVIKSVAAEVSEEAAEQIFTFVVTLQKTDSTPFTGNVIVSDKDNTNQVVTLTAENEGKLTLKIKGTGEATIQAIPDEITYTVSETCPANWQQKGDIIYSDTAKVIRAGDEDTATVTNEPLGNLEVTKTVTGSYSATDSDHYPITIKNAEGKYLNSSGELVADDPGITIKDTQTIQFNGIPVGVYTVAEGSVYEKGYTITTTYKVDSGSASSSIPNPEVKIGKTTSVEIINHYRDAELIIQKMISGVENADLDAVATTVKFTVTDGTHTIITDVPLNNSSIFIASSGGNYTATLRSADYEYIVPDASYTVTETTTDAAGYILTSTSYAVITGTPDSGNVTTSKTGGLTLTSGDTSRGRIEFTNTYAPASTTITIIKKNNEQTQSLAGAQFTLTKLEPDGSGWKDTETVLTTELTGNDGKVTIEGLTPGTYRLNEIKAPDGYMLTNETLLIEVAVVSNEVTVAKVDAIEHEMILFTDKDNILVKNQPASALPSTGGSGTLIYTITGIFLITLAGTLLVARKRKANR